MKLSRSASLVLASLWLGACGSGGGDAGDGVAACAGLATEGCGPGLPDGDAGTTEPPENGSDCVVRCGDTCLGDVGERVGSCTLVAKSRFVTDLAATKEALLYSTNEGVFRVDLADMEQKPLFADGRFASAQLEVSGDDLFMIASELEDTLYRVGVDGGEATALVTEPSIEKVVVSGANVYYSREQWDGGGVQRVSRDGGTPEQVLDVTPDDFALDDSHIYFLDPIISLSNLVAAPLSNTSERLELASEIFASSIAVHDDYVYFYADDMMRVKKRGGSAPEMIPGRREVRVIAHANDAGLYMLGGLDRDELVYVPFEGGEPEVLAMGPFFLEVTSTDDAVYALVQGRDADENDRVVRIER